MKSVVFFATLALLCTLVVMISAQECDLNAARACGPVLENFVRIMHAYITRSTTVLIYSTILCMHWHLQCACICI